MLTRIKILILILVYATISEDKTMAVQKCRECYSNGKIRSIDAKRMNICGETTKSRESVAPSTHAEDNYKPLMLRAMEGKTDEVKVYEYVKYLKRYPLNVPVLEAICAIIKQYKPPVYVDEEKVDWLETALYPLLSQKGSAIAERLNAELSAKAPGEQR
jgi:hypothetical protein